jgi:hypothetical protein
MFIKAFSATYSLALQVRWAGDFILRWPPWLQTTGDISNAFNMAGRPGIGSFFYPPLANGRGGCMRLRAKDVQKMPEKTCPATSSPASLLSVSVTGRNSPM